jgi:endonuclease YncB( thermonuclease family)
LAKRNVHVVPNGNGWAVKPEGASKPVSMHRTQRAAAEAGREVARENQSELFIHRPNGQIRDRDSYGNDPCPPKDSKK